MAEKKGNLSINSENMFPIIKKWLYSDHVLLEEHINQVAFSGASDFLEKYKDKDATDQIIGHFGLGFYSTFMVSERVDIDTRSYKEGAAPVHWTCDGGSEFEMRDGDRDGVGTTVTLHIAEDVHTTKVGVKHLHAWQIEQAYQCHQHQKHKQKCLPKFILHFSLYLLYLFTLFLFLSPRRIPLLQKAYNSLVALFSSG